MTNDQAEGDDTSFANQGLEQQCSRHDDEHGNHDRCRNRRLSNLQLGLAILPAKYTLSYFQVLRAKMILLAAQGLSNDHM